MSVDPSRLLLLLDLAEHGSVTRVAEHLGRTPPAVSQQLAKLEQEVGATLVERHPHGVRLTRLGEQLAGRARQVLDALRGADDDAARFLDEHRNRLRLGSFPTAGRALLPDVLASLRHRHPAAELSVIDLGPDEGISKVNEHELDLAIVAEYDDPIEAPPGVRLVPLLTDPVHAVLPVGHRLRARRGMRLRDFADDAWAAAPRSLPNRRQLDRAARAQGLSPNVPFESESYAVAEALVSAGVAVAFVPRLAITGVPGTAQVELDESALLRRIFAALPTDTRHAPLTEVCLRMLRDVCAEP